MTTVHDDAAPPEFDHPPADPLALLGRWVEDAEQHGVELPLAAALATTAPDGAPSVRIVSLKEVTERGVVFGTSAETPKGRDMRADPRVALTLFWRETMRQVRLTGEVTMLDDAASDRLFHARQYAAQAAEIVTRASEPLDSEAELRRAFREVAAQDAPLPRPARWRAWLITPDTLDFWAADTEQLHHRLGYTRSGEAWTARRLQP